MVPKTPVLQLEGLLEFVIDSEGLLMQSMTGSVKVVSVENFLRELLFCGLCEGWRSPGVFNCNQSRHRKHFRDVTGQSAGKQASKQSCLYGNCFRHNTSYQGCAGALVVQQTQTLDSR